MKSAIDNFMPSADIAECHEILIHAPADTVFEVAENKDLRSIPIVNAIFRLHEKLMRATPPRRVSQGLVAETLALGWGILEHHPGRELVMGAVTRPWMGDVKFRAVQAEKFVEFNEPDLVKIAWTLEVEPVDEKTTRFRTQTRVLATDEEARRKFRRYWLKFGLGIRLIRTLMNRAVKREAEERSVVLKYWTRFFKASLSYVGWVFGAGFMLGIVRTLWLMPLVGIRAAELIEMPIMVGITFVAARWVVRRLPASFGRTTRLAVGLAALSMLIALEIVLTVSMRGLSLWEYFTARDPVSGTAYFVALGLFSLMPCLLSRPWDNIHDHGRSRETV